METKKTKQEKITEDELADLKKIVSSQTEVSRALSNICLEKEVTLRSYNKSFDEKYELLEMKKKSLIDKQNKMLEALNSKYGQDVSYDLKTGNVIKIDKSNE